MAAILWTILFVVGTSWVTVQAQMWPGVYRMGSTCNTTSCCCLVNNLTVTQSSSNMLTVNTSLAGGLCLGQSSFTGQAASPNGYSLSISYSGFITLNVTLSRDSNTLTVANPLMPLCTGVGVRLVSVTTTTTSATTSPSAAAQPYMNGMVLGIMVLFSCLLNI